MPRGRKLKLDPDSKNKTQKVRNEKLKKEQSGLANLPNTPPAYLKLTARTMWKQLVPELSQSGIVKNIDRANVESFCTSYQLYRDAYADIQKNKATKPVYHTMVSPVTGEVVGKDFVGYKKNPSVTILENAVKNMKSLSGELGLTPDSRAKLMQIDSGEDEDVPSISDLLNGGEKF